MAKEIERKFKVRDLTIIEGLPGQRLTQGYVAARVAVHLRDDAFAFLVVRGPATTAEPRDFAYGISLADAEEMLGLCSRVHRPVGTAKLPGQFKVRALAVFSGKAGPRGAWGYLGEKVVTRVRVVDEALAFLTIKGPSNGAGSCDEFEYAVPLADTPALLALCGTRVLTKTRYKLPAGNQLWFELDVFQGPHAGLVVVEVELPTIDTPVVLPDWVGPELTGDYRYANSYLAVKGGA